MAGHATRVRRKIHRDLLGKHERKSALVVDENVILKWVVKKYSERKAV